MANRGFQNVKITSSFSEAKSRENLKSGETVGVLFGKIKKWFSDLKTVAFSGSYNDLSNKPTIPTKTSELTNDSGFKTTDTIYTHPTTSGNKHIPSGGSSGQILRWSADGTAVWGNDNNTTYTALKNPHALTLQFNGTTNKTYDGSSVQTLNITPSAIGAATSSHTHSYLPLSGGAMTGNISYQGTDSTREMIRFIDDNRDNINGNGIIICGGGATLIGGGESALYVANSGLSGNPILGGDEQMVISNDSAIDFYTNCNGGLNGAKHITMNTDGTITASGFNGNASTATALTSSAGSVTQPVYFSGGKPVACTYTLGKSVPSNAVFTDTTYGDATTSTHGLMTAAMVDKLNGIAAGANAYRLPLASSSTRGGVKIGYTANGKNYPVQLSNEQMYVNVPWTDTNTDTKVTSTLLNPTTSTTYFPVFVTGETTGSVRINSGIRYNTIEGTTNSEGYGSFWLGNGSASGTAGNKYGILRLYSVNSGYGNIRQASTTENPTHWFPTTGGTILNSGTTSFTQSLTSGTKIGTIKINGTNTVLYAPTNTDTHYTTGLKVGTSETATSNAAATNGNVYLNVLDNTTVRDSHLIKGTGATTVTSDANGVITIKSTNTTYSNFVKSGTGAKAGLVPAPSTTAGTTKYLREDGTWQVPPNTTYTALKNPHALTLQFNGTTNKTYDGSSVQTLNITPSAIGAAESSHNHSTLTFTKLYGGSASNAKNISYDDTNGIQIFSQGNYISFISNGVNICGTSPSTALITLGGRLKSEPTYNNAISGSNLLIKSDGTIGKATSSRRFKTNINYDLDTENYHNVLMNLKSVEYEYNSRLGTAELGMIAEEVEELSTIAALYEYQPIYDGDGNFIGEEKTGQVENYKDRAIIQMLVMEAQRKDKEIQELIYRVTQLEKPPMCTE